MTKLLTIACIILYVNCFSQEIKLATDFTLTDINQNEHNLYQYLDSGKIVILDFFAVWCVPCQNNTAGVEEVYLDHGPAGDNSIMILGLEGDDVPDSQVHSYAANYNCTNPQINSTGNVPGIYYIRYYPTYHVVCPDHTYSEVTGWPTTIENNLKEAINNCNDSKETINDVRITKILQPIGTCNQTYITPKIQIQNYGKDSLTSVNIVAELNNKTIYNEEWTGLLKQYKSTILTFPEISNLNYGENTLNFSINDPNGIDDDDASDNTFSTRFYPFDNETRFSIEIQDRHLNELSWKIEKDGEVFTTWEEPSHRGSRLFEYICLPENDCYTLTISDPWNDGFSGWEFAGIIINNDTIIRIQEHSFDNLEIKFCTGNISFGLENVYLSPNPASQYVNFNNIVSPSFNVIIYNSMGKKMAQYNSITINELPLDLSPFDSGAYLINIQTNNSEISKPLIIMK